MLIPLLKTILAWAMILPASFSLGYYLRRWVPVRDKQMQGVCFYAVGFAILSSLVVVLGIGGWIFSHILWGLIVVLFLGGLPALKEWIQWLKEWAADLWGGDSLLAKAMNFLFWIAAAALALACLTPEVGGDSLTYHINLPKNFLMQHSMEPHALDGNSYFPLFINSLYTLGLGTGGIIAAKLFHFCCGIFLFTAVKSSVTRLTQSVAWGSFAGLIVFLTPTAYNQLSTTYIDVALSLYTVLAVLVLLEGFESNSSPLIFLSGVFLGAALAMKYLAMTAGVALVVGWIVYAVQTRKAITLIKPLMLWGVGILVLSGYWLIRNWLVVDNPFYPYFGEVFAGVMQRPISDHHLFGTGNEWWRFFTLFLDMFLAPNSFGAFTNRVGVFYALLYPFIFLGIFFVPALRRLGAITLAFIVCLYFISRADRWMLPVLPLCAIVGLTSVKAVGDRLGVKLNAMGRNLIAYAGVGLLALYVLMGIYHYRYALLVPSNIWSFKEYAAKTVKSYPAAEWVNENLPQDAQILIQGEPAKFYFNRVVRENRMLKWHEKYEDRKWTNESFRDFLRSFGFEYFILSYPQDRIPDRGEKMLYRFATSSLAQQLAVIPSENFRDGKFTYEIYAIKSKES